MFYPRQLSIVQRLSMAILVRVLFCLLANSLHRSTALNNSRCSNSLLRIHPNMSKCPSHTCLGLILLGSLNSDCESLMCYDTTSTLESLMMAQMHNIQSPCWRWMSGGCSFGIFVSALPIPSELGNASSRCSCKITFSCPGHTILKTTFTKIRKWEQ